MDAYGRYAPALLRKARRLLGSPVDAEDVVHGLFVDLLQKNEPPPDLPYLYRAVTNRCLTLIRDRENRARLLACHEPALRGPVRTHIDDRAITLDLLARLVDGLDPAHVETLVYRFFDDLSLEEIADVMHVSRKTVQNRLSRVQNAIVGLGAGDAGGES
ncbi:MAG TPA: RNA polymerase sigma factor [Polyangiaceae bacterium]|jgi:RNA polymerase sigma-70 factor (ECF subfamily)|nr:RNA polymerase sigma factor [Polyangiaceae bacterium]